METLACPVCGRAMRRNGHGATLRKYPDRWECPESKREWDAWRAAPVGQKPSGTPHQPFRVYDGDELRAAADAPVLVGAAVDDGLPF